MKQFEAVVYDNHGIRQTITVNAATEQDAKRSLYNQDYRVVKLEPVGEAMRRQLFQREQLSLEQLEFFSAQIALLLKNGLRLDEVLSLLQKVADGPQLKYVIGRLLAGVREGKPLSEVMEERWGFDRLYISLVRIGETSGTIDRVFLGIAQDLKFRKLLKSKVRQAISYPLLVLVFSISAILFVFNVVIPRMSILFEAQENLPWYTQAMLGLADFVQQAQWLFVPFIALIVFVLLQAKELPKVKIALDRFAVSTPIISTFTKMLARIRYSSAMYLTVSAGVAIEQAMAQSAKVIGNGLLRQQLEAAQAKVRQGSSLADAFRQTIVYDDLHTGLIEVGEKSGDLESIFQEITEREQFDFENVVSRWTVLLEPILILLMAGLVGGVVVVMLMSIIAVQDISF